jgi:hypothetical protein
MKRKKIIMCILSLTMALTFFLPSVIYAQPTANTAPFWYGTVSGYQRPPVNYDPFLLDNGGPRPPILPCSSPTPPSIAANAQRNNQYLLFLNADRGTVRGLTIYKPEKAWDGYTLLSCVTGCAHPTQGTKRFKALLIDNEGNFVNGWENIKPFPAKMLPGGYVMGTDNETGGLVDSPNLIVQDWYGTEVQRWDLANYAPGALFHHDHNRQGSPVGYYAPGMKQKFEGKTVGLIMYAPDIADTSHISNYPLQDDAFLIFGKDGRLLWRWNAYEHFEQMGFSQKAKDGIMNTRLVGAQLPNANSMTDWTHFNNVNWLGENKWYQAGDRRFHPDNLIFDSRSSSLIAIIANDDYGGFKKGDIIWRVGPDYGPGTPWASLGQIIGPHLAHMIPASLPGGGNILVFSNGGVSRFGTQRDDCPGTYPSAMSDYSRVVEFNPVTYEVVWEYSNTLEFTDGDGNLNRRFYSTFMCGAQRLVNGNTLITETGKGRVFEVTREGEIVWEYIAGADFTNPLFGAAVYRAYKVPKSWVPY